MKLLSIIIPIYNTDPQILNRCLHSIDNIPFQDYEILLIDDGSDVFVEECCKRYCSDKESCFYYRKDNGGVSSARNHGIIHAEGKYIMFVDSDDVLFGDKILKEDFEEDMDLVFYDRSFIKNKRKSVRKEMENYGDNITVLDVFHKMISQNRFHNPVCKLYKRQILFENKIRFDENMIQGEDAIFNIHYLKKCQSFAYIHRSIYGYFLNSATVRQRWKSKPEHMFSDFRTLFLNKYELIEFFEEDQKGELRNQLISNTCYSLLQACMDMMAVKCFTNEMRVKSQHFIREILEPPFFLLKTNTLDKKAQIAVLLIDNSMWGVVTVVGRLREIYLTIKRTWK